MKNKKLFLKALSGLINYPGGDPSPENYWVMDDLVKFYESETGHTLDLPEYSEDVEWGEAVIESIMNDDTGLEEDIKKIKKIL
jgi:hypothetical protein